jgi:SHS2 domain-containing protein
LVEAFNSIGVQDPHDEAQFSAAHFDSSLVMEVIQSTVAERRTNQTYILLEGICNTSKLANEEERLTCREMDEFFMIEKCLGDIEACVSFTYNKEEEYTGTEEGVKFEEFPEEVVKEVKPVDDGEGEGEAEAEEGEKKVVFNPRDH